MVTSEIYGGDGFNGPPKNKAAVALSPAEEPACAVGKSVVSVQLDPFQDSVLAL